MATISAKDIQAMVSHWLKTPVNGYLGSDYGQDVKSLLQKPLSDGSGDAFLQKMRADIPLLSVIPSNRINLYLVNRAPDKKELYIDVAGTPIQVVTED